VLVLRIQNDRLRHHQASSREWINRFTWIILTLQGSFALMASQRMFVPAIISAGLTSTIGFMAFLVYRTEVRYQDEALVSVWLLEDELGLLDQKKPPFGSEEEKEHTFKHQQWVTNQYRNRIKDLEKTPMDKYIEQKNNLRSLFSGRLTIRKVLQYLFLIFVALGVIEFVLLVFNPSLFMPPHSP
jgi:type IV secretory pathway VirB2 component (pilin)